MIEDPLFYMAAIPAVLLVGLSKGGFGGGLALLSLPIMALIISPIQAAAIMLPILILMDMIGLIAWRGVFDRKCLMILTPAAMVGIGVGWATAAYVTSAHVRLIVGVVALMFWLDYMLGGGKTREPRAHNPRKGWFWGAMSGFTSFVSHAGGPPFQMYVLPLRLDPKMLAGTAIIFFSIVNAVKVVPYLALGQFSPVNLMTSAVLLPLAPLGTLAGVRLVKIVPQATFYRITYSVVFVISLKLIWDGLNGLFA
jgi:uncharacterized membrane protein YfcA